MSEKDQNYDVREDRDVLRRELEEIARRCAALPPVSELTDDEILGYDEFGIPTR